MALELWGSMVDEPTENGHADDGGDKYLYPPSKKIKFEEIFDGPLPMDNKHIVELRSSLVTQTIEVMKQTEMLQSLIETYSNKNGTSNYLLNPCLMIPEVDFPPENAADLVGEQRFQKPIWFTPTMDTAYSRGDPQSYPHLSTDACRLALRKAMSGMLRLAGFTDCSETAMQLLTDAKEEFLRGFISKYRACNDTHPRLRRQTSLRLLPLERAHVAVTGISLTQVHNYYKHKVIGRNRVEIGEFENVLQEYDKLMKESQSSMQKQQQQQQQQQHHEFNGSDFLSMLDNSATGSNQSMAGSHGLVNDILGDFGGSSAGSSGTVSSQQQLLYGLLDAQVSSTSTMPGTSSTDTGSGTGSATGSASGSGSSGSLSGNGNGNGNGNGHGINSFHATFESQ